MKKFLTVQQVAELLNISLASVYQLCAERKIKHHRLGMGRGTIRITEEQLQDFLTGTERRGESVPPNVNLRELKFRGSRRS